MRAFQIPKKFAGILRDVISSHAEELKGAKALINGNLVNVDEQCSFDGVLHEVEFLIPFMQHTSFQAYSEEEVVGILVFTGSVCCRCWWGGFNSDTYSAPSTTVIKERMQSLFPSKSFCPLAG